MGDKQGEWWHAKAHARHLGLTNTVAVDNLQTPRHATLPFTPQFSSMHVQRHTVMPMTMGLALLPAKLTTIQLCSARTPMGMPLDRLYSSGFINVSKIVIENRRFCLKVLKEWE